MQMSLCISGREYANSQSVMYTKYIVLYLAALGLSTYNGSDILKR